MFQSGLLGGATMEQAILLYELTCVDSALGWYHVTTNFAVPSFCMPECTLRCVCVSLCEPGSIDLQVRTVTGSVCMRHVPGSVCMRHVPPPTGEAGKFDTLVQETFNIKFRLTSPNFHDNHGDSSSEYSLWDPGVNFWQMRTFPGPVCVHHASPPRAHLQKDHYYVIQPPL